MATESPPFDVQALALSYLKEPEKRVDHSDRMMIVEHLGDIVAGVGLLQQVQGATSLVPRFLAESEVLSGCLNMANPDLQGQDKKALSRGIHETIANALIAEDANRDALPPTVPTEEDARRVNVLAKKLAERPPLRYDFSKGKVELVQFRNLNQDEMAQWKTAAKNVLRMYAQSAQRVEGMSDEDYDNSLQKINQTDGAGNSLFRDMLYATGSLAFPDPGNGEGRNTFMAFIARNQK